MDDDEDDDMGGGAPPDDPRFRVWTPEAIATAASAPPTADERARFGIPEPSPAASSAMAKIAAKREADSEAADRPDPRIAVLAALVAKFPEFDANWPEKVQERWFSGFERIMDAGLK